MIMPRFLLEIKEFAITVGYTLRIFGHDIKFVIIFSDL